MTEGDDNSSRRLVPIRARAPLLITLLAVGVVGAAYYTYYRKQADYFTGRNLRLLSMLTAQIEGRVEMYAGFARTAGHETSRGMQAVPCAPANRGGNLRREILGSSTGWNVVLQPPAPDKCSAIALDSILRPVFARRVGAAFDILIVARDDGTVLYSTRQAPTASTLLHQEEEWIDEEAEEPHVGDKESASAAETAATASAATGAAAERESGSTVLLTRLQALSTRKGWREYEPLKPATLADANGQSDVVLGDNAYVLFSQPYTFANSTVTLDQKPRRWIVCGLVSASRFRYDVSAVSTTVILLAIAVVALALCCWPFLRIALIDPRQALTITDVVLIVICIIVGAAVVTLALLDAFAYRNMSSIADQQLEDYSKKLHDDFRGNVLRAADMLSAVESATAKRAQELASLPGQPKGEPLTEDLLTDERIQKYPYIHSIQWIDDVGMQRARFDRIVSPLQRVSDRQYFQLALKKREWSVDGRDYVLEWVRSKSTGEVWALMAKKTAMTIPPLAVVAVATELIDVTHTVGPPGVEMAIIDENGEVIYHSDTQRIGYENFFAEADRNRDLRSAVVARRAGAVDAKYWGEDESMYVRPLTGSGWTLVTFRPKRLTRVLNVEGSLLTLVLLVMSALPWFIVYILVLLIFPGYRAPRLWPDISRTRDYARLSVILVALLLLFWMNVYALAPWSYFWEILILPNLAIVSTYLVLHRTGAEGRYRIATGLWIAVNAVLVAHLISASVDPTRRVGEHPIVLKSVLVLAALAVALLTQLLLSWHKSDTRRAKALRSLCSAIGYTRLYRLCGVLLLVVCVTMPVVGFFAISRRVESQLLVKYAQLRAAADLEHRIDHVETLNALRDNTKTVADDVLCTSLRFIFDSRWGLRPAVTPAPPCATEPRMRQEQSLHKRQELERKRSQAAETIPDWAATSLPVLYEDSLAVRLLFDSHSADNLWSWQADDGYLTLLRKVRFDVDVADMVWANSLTGKPAPKEELIVIESAVPHVAHLTAWVYLAAGILIAGLLLAAFCFVSTFMAKRVLLIDVTEPDWLVPLPFTPTLGDQIFLVREGHDPTDLTDNDPKGNSLPFFDVSFKDLLDPDRGDQILEAVDSSEPGRNVRIIDFESGIDDAASNEKKLHWLERLLALGNRTVVIVSTVTPAYMMTTTPPPSAPGALSYFDRWRAVLDRFVCISAEELLRRNQEWDRRQVLRTTSQLSLSEPKSWEEKETAYNPFLKQLAKEIEAEAEQRRETGQYDATTDREHLLDEIGERAETYYAGLWASCREEEKILLDQLANNGLANGRNRRVLRRLMARGLVRRNPNLALFSETFRLYVLAAAQREDVANRARAQHGPSTWDSLRVPFFIIITAFVLLLFATQKDLLTTTTALATALTTGLPVLMKLIGVFTERRMGTTDRT